MSKLAIIKAERMRNLWEGFLSVNYLTEKEAEEMNHWDLLRLFKQYYDSQVVDP